MKSIIMPFQSDSTWMVSNAIFISRAVFLSILQNFQLSNQILAPLVKKNRGWKKIIRKVSCQITLEYQYKTNPKESQIHNFPNFGVRIFFPEKSVFFMLKRAARFNMKKTDFWKKVEKLRISSRFATFRIYSWASVFFKLARVLQKIPPKMKPNDYLIQRINMKTILFW